MALETIQNSYNDWKEATQKFDYFILGASLALFAYEAERWKPVQLSWSSGTVELCGIVFILISILCGFLRIDCLSKLFYRSYVNLIAEAVSKKLEGSILMYDSFEDVIDSKTGAKVPKSKIEADAKFANTTLVKSKTRLESLQTWSTRYVLWRNATLALGFLLLLLAKIMVPYGV